MSAGRSSRSCHGTSSNAARSAGGFSPVVDVLSWIERKEAVPRGDTGVYIFGGLQVVGVRPEALLPAFGEDAPGCVVENLLGASASTLHLSYGLLGEDGREPPSGGAQGPDVARGGEAQPVAETRRGACTERPRTQPGQQVA